MLKNTQLRVFFITRSPQWLCRILFCLAVIVSVNVLVVKIIFESRLSNNLMKNEKYEALNTNRKNLFQHYNLMDDDSFTINYECSEGNLKLKTHTLNFSILTIDVFAFDHSRFNE